jgi:hypothetical protein
MYRIRLFCFSVTVLCSLVCFGQADTVLLDVKFIENPKRGVKFYDLDNGEYFDDPINSICLDSLGQLWAWSHINGLMKFSDGCFVNPIGIPSGLKLAKQGNMLCTPDGVMWFSYPSDSSSLYSLADGVWESHVVGTLSQTFTRFHQMACDKQGRLYLSGFGYLVVYDDRTWFSYSLPPEVHVITSLTIANDGRVAIYASQVFGGVFILENYKWTRIEQNDSVLAKRTIYHIQFIDDDLYISYGHDTRKKWGYAVCDSTSIVSYYILDYIDSPVQHFFIDSYRTLCLSTASGILFVKNKVAYSFSKEDEDFIYQFYNILEVGEFLYISSNMGLMRLKKYRKIMKMSNSRAQVSHPK